MARARTEIFKLAAFCMGERASPDDALESSRIYRGESQRERKRRGEVVSREMFIARMDFLIKQFRRCVEWLEGGVV